MALQIRRGTNAQRNLITPLPGELIFTTDVAAKDLYIGDGTTLGGVFIGGTSNVAGRTEDQLQDLIAAMFTDGTHSDISFTYNDTTGTIEAVVTAASIDNEAVQNIVGTMITSGTHSNISFTYDDTLGTINATVPTPSPGLTIQQAEDVEEVVATMLLSGTNTNVTYTYDDENRSIDTFVFSIANLSQDPTPKLGGNLSMNNYEIRGNGNIVINGTVSALELRGNVYADDSSVLINKQTGDLFNGTIALGGANINSVTGLINIGTQDIPLTTITKYAQTDKLTAFTSGSAASGGSITVAAYKGTADSPSALVPNDFVGQFKFEAYNSSVGNYRQLAGIISGVDTITGSESQPGSTRIFNRSADSSIGLGGFISFGMTSRGIVDMDVLQLNAFADAAARDARITATEIRPGLMVWIADIAKLQVCTNDDPITWTNLN